MPGSAGLVIHFEHTSLIICIMNDASVYMIRWEYYTKWILIKNGSEEKGKGIIWAKLQNAIDLAGKGVPISARVSGGRE